MNIHEITQCFTKKKIKRPRSTETKGRFLGLGKSQRQLRILFLEKRALTSANHTTVITFARALAKVGENYGTSFACPWLSHGRRITNQLGVWLARARSNSGSGRTRFALRLREAECAASTMNQAPHFTPSRRTAASPPPPVSSVASLFLSSQKII